MRATLTSLLICAALAACRDRGGERPRDNDTLTVSSGGEVVSDVALTDGETMRYTITSERYKRWYAAQSVLDKSITSRISALLNPAAPSSRSIDATVSFLEGNGRARSAIEGAGMSVRDFVVTTLALEQEMRAATARGEAPAYSYAPVDTMPRADSMMPPIVPTYPPPAYPPGYPPPAYPPPAYATPLPPTSLDTSRRRVDTVFLPSASRDTSAAVRDSIARAIIARHDSVIGRRDTALARRDSLRRSFTLPPRDTIRRDTIRRDTIKPPSNPPGDTLSALPNPNRRA